MVLILALIAVSYIGVGLPDSVLGTVWPAVYEELNLPISLAGYIALTISFFTTISCLVSTRLTAKFGTGKVAVVSTFLTAFALIGLSFSQNAAFFFLLSVPLGIGAGTIDSALNGFVALNCTSSQMSYLHCFYGLGVTLSPYLIYLCLSDGNNWRRAYLTVGLIQLGITLILLIGLPYWMKKEKSNLAKEEMPLKVLSTKELLRMPAVALSCLVFFIICACEYTAGVWSSTFFAEYKGFPPNISAKAAMLFYIGMTLGRFCSGLLGKKLGSKEILKICVGILLTASLTMALPLPTIFTQLGLLLFGFGMGPTFPNLSYLAPTLFGREISQSVIGIQLASTYVGIMIMPPVFGMIAEKVSAGLFPYFLFVLMILFTLSYASLMRLIKKEKVK